MRKKETLRLFRQQFGLSDQPRVILVHGTMDRSSSFRRMLGLLGAFEVIAYDRRGYANSPFLDGLGNAKEVSVQLHLQDLLEILEERPSIVFGHSYGGTLGLLAAAQKPANLAGLVVFEPPLPWLPEWSNRIPYNTDMSRGIDAEWAKEQAEQFVKSSAGAESWEKLSPESKDQRRSEGITMVSEMKSLSQLKPAPGFCDISIPVTLARSADAAQRRRHASEYLYSIIPTAVIEVVSGTGHSGHTSRPDEMARIITEISARARLT